MTDRRRVTDLADLALTDLQLDAVASRSRVDGGDTLFDGLAVWARELDEYPLPAVSWDWCDTAGAHRAGPGRRYARSMRYAAGLAAALTLSSTGFAAAVSGDPWSPIHFVSRHFHGAHHPPADQGLKTPAGDARVDDRQGNDASRSAERPRPDVHGRSHRKQPNAVVDN